MSSSINRYTRHTSICRGVDFTQLAESHSLSMLPVYLHLSPTCNLNYLEYISDILTLIGFFIGRFAMFPIHHNRAD
ncbi:hypothetical protein M2263_002411 [Providencia alcalifaciens]|nr:hypothetical protein [Providencia alcalifaciens]